MLRYCHLNILVKRILRIKADHIRTGYHNFTHISVGKIKYVVHKIQLCLVNIALFVAFFHENADFLLRMGRIFTFCFHRNPQLFRCIICHMVQEPHKRIHHLLKEQHRHGNIQCHRLCLLNSQIFRNQLTADNVHCRNQPESYGKGNSGSQGAAQPEVHKYRLQHMAHRRLTQPAKAQGSQRNAQLGNGQGHIQMVGELLGVHRPVIALINHGFQPGTADFHHRKFCRHKKAIHQHQ